jgi:predicted ATP-grasp superfamily ATP-dependent carboligase
MTTVFVYEDVSATGAGRDGESRPAPSLLAEGRAMLAAVAADFRSVPGARVLQFGTAPFTELARAADYTLIIAPECGGRLEHLCREVLSVGGRLLGPSPGAVRLTADKLDLARHWDRHGVPTPRTWPLGEEPAGPPVVVKPRDGAGSQATAISLVEADWPGPLIAQEYVQGFPASVAFLVGRSRLVPLIPCQQLLSDDGRFQYRGGRLPIPPGLAERAVRVATAAVACVSDLLGYVGVDLVLGEDGRDWAIEINPRLTTSYVGLRALAKFNLAEAMLAAVRGEPLPELGWGSRGIEFMPDGRASPLAT